MDQHLPLTDNLPGGEFLIVCRCRIMQRSNDVSTYVPCTAKICATSSFLYSQQLEQTLFHAATVRTQYCRSTWFSNIHMDYTGSRQCSCCLVRYGAKNDTRM